MNYVHSPMKQKIQEESAENPILCYRFPPIANTNQMDNIHLLCELAYTDISRLFLTQMANTQNKYRPQCNRTLLSHLVRRSFFSFPALSIPIFCSPFIWWKTSLYTGNLYYFANKIKCT